MALSGSIKSRMAAGSRIEKVQLNRVVSLRQRGFLVYV